MVTDCQSEIDNYIVFLSVRQRRFGRIFLSFRKKYQDFIRQSQQDHWSERSDDDDDDGERSAVHRIAADWFDGARDTFLHANAVRLALGTSHAHTASQAEAKTKNNHD